MGPRLTALLSIRGFAELDAEIRAIRAWRRAVPRAKAAGDALTAALFRPTRGPNRPSFSTQFEAA
jgi:hypothetical protein